MHEDHWRRLIGHLAGKSGLRFLEIGSFEGRSAVWWVDNILTGDGCRLVCLDLWRQYDEFVGVDWDETRHRFGQNIDQCSRPEIVDVHSASAYVYAACVAPGAFFDFVYIDGDHHALACLTDAVIGWQMLKPGGIMLFDDTEWPHPGTDPSDNPMRAVHAMQACARDAQTIMTGPQSALLKLPT